MTVKVKKRIYTFNPLLTDYQNPMVMKKVLILIVTILPIFSCSNDGNLIINQIIGNWVWIQSSGGIDGRTETPKSTQTTKKLEITKNLIRSYVNDTLRSETSYKLEIGESIRGKNSKLIIYENGGKQSYEIFKNELILYDNCYDCFQHNYIKG